MTVARNWPWIGLKAVAWLVLAFLFLPLLLIIPASLSDQSHLSLPRNGLSVRHYAKVFQDPVWLAAIGQTLFVALAAASAATVLGGLAAIACWRTPGKWAWALRGLVLLPLIVPPIVSALGFYQLWASLKLLDTYAGVIIAFTIKTVPYTFTAVASSLFLLDVRLEQAARNLGASRWSAIMTVVVPAARPGILSGLLFAFVYVWDEIVILLFISSREIRLLSRLIWEGLQDTVDPAIAVVSATLTILTAIAILVLGFIQRDRLAT